MPSKRTRGAGSIEAALAALSRAFGRTRTPWMVIGGIAVVARGVRRMTTDIDAVVPGNKTSPAAVIRALSREQIVPRIGDAAAFAAESLVLLVRHAPTGVDLDVAFCWTPFEHEALTRRSPAAFGTATAPMAAAEDLVVFKAMAARPKDIDDATALLIMHPDIDRVAVRARVAKLSELADDPSLLRGLDAIITMADKHAALARATGTAAPRIATPRNKVRRKPRQQ